VPRRMITPEIWFNEKVGILPDTGRLLFIGIFSNADDDGRLKASAKFLKAHIFPYDDDKTTEQIEELRDKCVQVGLIRLYKNGTEEFLDIPGWCEHQQIRKDRYNPSKLPSFKEVQGQLNQHTDSKREGEPPGQGKRGSSATNRKPNDNQAATTGSHSIVKSSLVKSSLNTPPKGGARKKRADTQADPRIKEVFNEIHQFFGYPNKVQQDPIPNYGKEGQFIKKMLGRGFTRVEILACWTSKVSQRGGEFVSMQWVNEDIGKKGGVGEQPRPKQARAKGPLKYIRGSSESGEEGEADMP